MQILATNKIKILAINKIFAKIRFFLSMQFFFLGQEEKSQIKVYLVN
jgi:hypothetical protein